MEITINISRAQLAAVREDLRINGENPTEAQVIPHIEKIINSALDSLRDRYRTDAEDTLSFIRRNNQLYAGLNMAAVNDQNIADALDALHSEPVVWKGSIRAQQLAAGLVAAGILTQEQVDSSIPGSLLYFNLPELLPA